MDETRVKSVDADTIVEKGVVGGPARSLGRMVSASLGGLGPDRLLGVYSTAQRAAARARACASLATL